MSPLVTNTFVLCLAVTTASASLVNPPVTQSTKKFLKDLPADKRAPAGDHYHFDHPYPAVQDTGDFDQDFVKDENADGGKWQAQMEYDLLRAKVHSAEKDLARLQKRFDKESTDVEKAKATWQLSQPETTDAESVVTKAQDALKTANKDVESLQESIESQTADVEKEVKDLEECKKALEDAKQTLKDLKAQEAKRLEDNKDIEKGNEDAAEEAKKTNAEEEKKEEEEEVKEKEEEEKKKKEVEEKKKKEEKEKEVKSQAEEDKSIEEQVRKEAESKEEQKGKKKKDDKEDRELAKKNSAIAEKNAEIEQKNEAIRKKNALAQKTLDEMKKTMQVDDATWKKKISEEKAEVAKATEDYFKVMKELEAAEAVMKQAAQKLKKYRRAPHVDSNGGVYNVEQRSGAASVSLSAFAAAMLLVVSSC